MQAELMQERKIIKRTAYSDLNCFDFINIYNRYMLLRSLKSRWIINLISCNAKPQHVYATVINLSLLSQTFRKYLDFQLQSMLSQ